MGVIKKIEVTTGVYWVEIADADLYILCGCPADSVKHLMRRGLIVPEEVQGVMAETGPNAILLSDSLIQNGEFVNLAEFPVLQMLYRQGTILPNHPNNTGSKPLLIGSESQVQAQMRYIHRGNYGLLSEHEMTRAGVDLERAKQEMRLKLRFAFGTIREPEDFLDTLSVGDRPVEIRGGVTIKRKGHNVFEFRYGEESIEVNLNLPKGLAYVAPYALGFQDVGREYFAVVHSGNGDGWDINRPAMASIITFQGHVYLIDAGPNIKNTLYALGIGVNEIKGIFHTHAHDDHFCGLTTLMQADHRIQHFATPLVRASIAKKWSALLTRPESEFEIYFEIIDLIEGAWNNVDGLEVKPMFSPHPLETTVMYFRTRAERGYKMYAHLADITSKRVMEDFLVEDEHSPGLSQEMFDTVWEEYLIPADVKKVDIGGGLIHGEAGDFQHDRSSKIILSHTALPLTNQQKEIGSEASFGMVDVLIAGKQDFVRSRAFHYLVEYMPGAEAHELKMLMNSEMISFNPGDIILRRGEVAASIYLVVTGVLELLDSATDVANHLSSGGMVGDVSGLKKLPSRITFRAMTHVRALKFPRGMLADVVEKKGMAERIEKRRAAREFLEETWLFDGLSSKVQNKVTKAMISVTYHKGDMITHEEMPAVFLISKGQVDIRFGDTELQTLHKGEFLGEGFVTFDTPCITLGWAVGEVELFVIPASVVRDIPVVRWKLYETFRNRVSAIVESVPSGLHVFDWRPEFSTGVEIQDEDHRGIMRRAKEVYQLILNGCSAETLNQALDEFVRFTVVHFKREIEWYEEAGFSELEHHRVLHRNLLQDLRQKVNGLRSDCIDRDAEFLVFFKDWLIDHILTEDRKFGALVAFRKS